MKKSLRLILVSGTAISSITYFRPLEINISYGDVLFIIGLFGASLLTWRRINIFGTGFGRFFYLLGVSFFYTGFFLSFFNADPLRFLLSIAQYSFCFFALPFVFSVMLQCSPDAVDYAGKWFVLVLAGTCALGFIGYFSVYDTLREIDMVSGSGRFQGFSGNPNIFASLLTLSIPLVFALRFKQVISGFCHFIIVVCFAAGLAVTSSFGGMIGSVLTISTIALTNFRLISVVKAVLAAVAIVLIFNNFIELPAVFEKRILSVWESGGVTDLSQMGSYDTRAAVAREAVDRIAESPFIGVGLDNYLEFTNFGHTVHNTLLLVWAEGGAFSLIGLIVVAFAPLVIYLASIRPSFNRQGIGVALSYTVALFFTMQVFAHLYTRAWFIPYFLTIVILLSTPQYSPQKRG